MDGSKQTGMVLLAVTIILLIFSLLSLQLLEQTILQKRMAINVQLENELQHVTEALIREGVKMLESSQAVTFEHLEILNNPRQLSETWWQQHAVPLTIQRHQGFYIIEKFSEDACTKIAGTATIGAKFYRITAYLKYEPLFHPMIMQAFYVAPAVGMNCVEIKQKRLIYNQWQSWRRLE